MNCTSSFVEHKIVWTRDNIRANRLQAYYEGCYIRVFCMRWGRQGNICRFLGTLGQATRIKKRRALLYERFVSTFYYSKGIYLYKEKKGEGGGGTKTHGYILYIEIQIC
jgi:hypothetical protein